MLTSILRAVLIWFRIIQTPSFIAEQVSEHPNPYSIEPSLVYIIGGHQYQKWAVFKCPCGCDEITKLSLAKKRHPRWAVKIDWIGRPSVHPSVRQLDGCYSHYWIKAGDLHWCEDTGKKPEYVI